jgi:integrase
MSERRDYGSGSVFQRKSDGRWLAQVPNGTSKNGTRLRKTVSAKTEREVKKKLAKLQAKVAADGKVSGINPRTTVTKYATAWLERTAATSRPKTYTTDKGAVTAWIIPTIGHRRLADLEPDDVRAVATALRKAGKSTSTMRRYHGVLIRILKAAMLDGHPIAPRVLMAEKPDEAPNDRTAMTVPEALAVLEVASHSPDGSRWAIRLLQGMRQGELLGTTWDALDLDAETLRLEWQLQSLPYLDKSDRSKGFRIPDGYEARRLTGAYHLVRPKSRAGWRVIPLVPWAVDALRTWKATGPPNPYGLVWAAPNGSPINLKDDTRQWQALQTAAGVAHPDGRPYHGHETRHTTATLLDDLGVPESTIIRILGQSSVLTARKYVHKTSSSDARAALEKVAERLELAAPPR